MAAGEIVLRIVDEEDGTISPPPKFFVPMDVGRALDAQTDTKPILVATTAQYPSPRQKEATVMHKINRGETCLFAFTDPSNPSGPKLTAPIESLKTCSGNDPETGPYEYLYIVCGLSLADYEALLTFGYITSQQF